MKDIELKPWEQVHDIMAEGLKIIQNKNGFKYGTDGVLLGNFVKSKKNDEVLDFCSGSGIIPLIILSRQNNCKVTGLEIDEDVVETANKTAKINELEDKLQFIQGDIKKASKILKKSYDIVTCNPPYSKTGSGKVSESSKIARARYELDCSLKDVCENAAKVLKFGGKFYIVHKAERLADIIYYCKMFKIEPKEIQFVYTKKDSDAKLVLLCGVLGAGVQVKILPPYILGES